MANPFGGSRVQVKPPERGVFALDHDGECKEVMRVYLACLKENRSTHFDCRELSGKYLSCRMEKDLMAKEDLNHLGLGELDSGYVRKVVEPEKKREDEGFIAGTGVRTSNKWFGGIFESKKPSK